MRVIPELALPEVDEAGSPVGSAISSECPPATSFGAEYTLGNLSQLSLANEPVKSAADIPEGCRIRDITATFLDPVSTEVAASDVKSGGIKLVLLSVAHYRSGLPGYERSIEW
jgi:hypothetical protein